MADAGREQPEGPDFSQGVAPEAVPESRALLGHVAGEGAVMAREGQERPIVDDVPLIVFAGDRGLHPVIQDLDRYAVQCFERLDVTAQQCLQVLMENIAGEQEARVAQHQAEQPHDPACGGLIVERDDGPGAPAVRYLPDR